MLRRIVLPAVAILSLAACSRDAEVEADTAPVETVQTGPVPPAAGAIPGSQNPRAQAIDQAVFASPPATAQPATAVNPAPSGAAETGAAADASAQASGGAPSDPVIRAQVLLDRANFSPGVIDGLKGENFRQALHAYEEAHGLPADGELDSQVFSRLTSADSRPVMTDYTITQEDVAGPFVDRIPESPEARAKMERLAYTSPEELLAEKFHMDVDLLRDLNPETDFSAAGTVILVAAPGPEELPAKVARIEVDKAERMLRAYDGSGRIVAVYPATVGSESTPAPSGQWAVRAVAPDPTYTIDPDRVGYADPKAGKLTLPPGPNSPVGVVWIDLTKDTYGIHGTSEPAEIGKTASHGCVRLTNWDVTQLSRAVEAGVPVVFVGAENGTGQT